MKKKGQSSQLNRFLSSVCIFLVGVIAGIIFTCTVNDFNNRVTVENYEDPSFISDVNIPRLKEKLQSSEKNKSNKSADSKININTANLEELCSLPGIGETIAQKIIDYRYENGYFEKTEDIMNVNRIGESLYDKIKDLITI